MRAKLFTKFSNTKIRMITHKHDSNTFNTNAFNNIFTFKIDKYYIVKNVVFSTN